MYGWPSNMQQTLRTDILAIAGLDVTGGETGDMRLMDWREFFKALAGAPLVWPNILQAQQVRKLARIGLLTIGSTTAEMTGPEPQSPVIKSFLGGMRALGYVYGKDFVTEPRGGAGMPERYA